jgi:hypothetical protein
MLVAMDILPATNAWIALSVVVVVLLLAGAGLLLRRRTSSPTVTDPPEDRRDDLADFLEHPPGTPGALLRTDAGWTALGTPAAMPDPAPARPPHTSGRRGTRAAPAGAAAALVLLAVTVSVAAVAVAVAVGDGHPRDGSRERDGRDRGAQPDHSPQRVAEARLAFEGLVLQPHAVGVTATYPELRLTGEGDRLRAHLELPTWNCLTGEAPADPVAAGCRRAVTEVADLAEPELELTGTGDGLRLTGRFATSTAPGGSGPVSTQRSYALDVTVEVGDRRGTDWLPAQGVLRLGSERAESTGTDLGARVNVLRYRER